MWFLKEKTKIPKDSSTDIRGGHNGDLLYKRKPHIPKIIGDSLDSPLGLFVCFALFFPRFVRPHATNKILSTGEEKESTEQWVWGTGARKSAGQGGRSS